MTPHVRLSSAMVAAALLLTGCGGDKPETAEKAENDPAVSGALAGPIMVDPELSDQNPTRAGMAGGGAATAEIPPLQRGPEAIAAAVADATKLAGGAIRTAPEPAKGLAAAQAVTAAQLAARSGGADCAGKVDYSAIWAARLPAALEVYPRGHVQEAAGTDTGGCRLRVVNFLTPVSVSDVINFYYTRLRAAGYAAAHRTEGRDSVLSGAKGASAYTLYVRGLDGGLTEVDLISNGG